MPLRLIALLCMVSIWTPATPDDEVQGFLKTLRDRRLSANEKVEALDGLLVYGVDRLPPTLAKEMSRLEREYKKERADLIKGMASGSRRVIRSRQNGRVMAEVKELQEKVLGIARGGGLTKEKIKAESDPAVARLREILEVTPSQVYDEDEDLEQLSFRVWELNAELNLLWGYWVKTVAALEGDEDGQRVLERTDAPWDPTADEAELLDELAFQCELATPMTKLDMKTLITNRELAAEIPAPEAEGNRILNRLRLVLGLNVVLTDVKLCEAARGHSKDMKEHDFFSHTSPLEGKETVGKRAALAGTSAGAENIAYGQGSPQAAIDAWWYSPGHHKNMLGGHSRVGLGNFDTHWTQMFG
ncbi:MAG: CAP domain-containing protein [Planctomycetota bacterium]